MKPEDNIDGADEAIQVNNEPIQGPPELVRAAGLQRAYWTPDAAEQARLASRGLDGLSWRERLRLHHLNCLQRIHAAPGEERTAATHQCWQTLKRLMAGDSPYRPRQALLWHKEPGSEAGRDADFNGVLGNPSITHLGCLEIFRLDEENRPVRLDFVSLDEISGVLLARPSLIRAAKLVYWDRREEIVFMPLLYGLTWSIGSGAERSGGMTRFLAHLPGAALPGGAGIGVGQQDLCAIAPDGAARLFGIGSIGEILLPLDVRDPDFDRKARARGLDPEQFRRPS